MTSAPARKKSVLLFGTSANPPTGRGGHAGIIAWAAARDDVDEIWVLPVYRHAFEEKREMPSFDHRMAMARLAFEPISPKVKVLDVERRVAEALPREALVGTIDVVRALEREHPEAALGLLLGADTYRDLMSGKWKESEALRQRVRVLAVARKGVDEDLAGPDLDALSSTECRQIGETEGLAGRVAPEVVAYIRKHHLYAFG